MTEQNPKESRHLVQFRDSEGTVRLRSDGLVQLDAIHFQEDKWGNKKPVEGGSEWIGSADLLDVSFAGRYGMDEGLLRSFADTGQVEGAVLFDRLFVVVTVAESDGGFAIDIKPTGSFPYPGMDAFEPLDADSGEVTIVGVRFAGGEDYRHIRLIRWFGAFSDSEKTSPTERIVEFIESGGTVLTKTWDIRQPNKPIEVAVDEGGNKYLRSGPGATPAHDLLQSTKF